MNILVLINSLINKEETFKSFEKYFNDGNNYFVYSLEEALPDFQNFNFKNFKMADLIKIEQIKIISDSKYLRINSKIFDLGRHIFDKFYDEIIPVFYGYMIDNIAEVNKFTEKECISKKIKVIEQIRSDEFEILPFDYIKYVDINKENLKIEITEEIENYREILDKFNYFIFTSNKDLKIEKFTNGDIKIPNFIFFINDLSNLADYIKYFRNKKILYLNQDDYLLFFNERLPLEKNSFYQIELTEKLGIGCVSFDNVFNPAIGNFIFSSEINFDLSKFHCESLYNDIRTNNCGCKAQTCIGSLKKGPKPPKEQEEDGKI